MTIDSLGQEMGKIELPVYLNSTREDLLFTVDLPVQPVRIFHIYELLINYFVDRFLHEERCINTCFG